MEKIEPLRDHRILRSFPPGTQVEFRGKSYTVLQKTTLASGEPALVLKRDGEQFAVGSTEFLSGTKKIKSIID